MGFFNMIVTISGAIVTAVVAKAMEQKLFAFPLHPMISNADAYLYGNLILFLSIVITVSGVLYYVTFNLQTDRQPKPTTNE
ncbi:hypothetical protein [Caldalkalibacillus mannanilyticus]|uniref:hypothetical protein n=1 Tax=Caldalkalibacillus mannanilyticus TaxID=1418 RepID=UPI0006881EF1|nr:hypothetical protein [Caldalkalibacillus mannanilyticus]